MRSDIEKHTDGTRPQSPRQAPRTSWFCAQRPSVARPAPCILLRLPGLQQKRLKLPTPATLNLCGLSSKKSLATPLPPWDATSLRDIAPLHPAFKPHPAPAPRHPLEGSPGWVFVVVEAPTSAVMKPLRAHAITCFTGTGRHNSRKDPGILFASDLWTR